MSDFLLSIQGIGLLQDVARDDAGVQGGRGGIPVFVGILVGLVASFVQSLGLTIQRKSHLENDSRPPERQRKAHRRPLWLVGFAIFISSNLFGTVFQIGALPIVILAPLGAVSLLWNALLSRILLGDLFSATTLVGTLLIAGGATLIAIFGVVPEQNHNLDELLALFRRPGFVVYITLMSVAVAVVLVTSHIIELGLNRRQRRIRLVDATDEPQQAAKDGLGLFATSHTLDAASAQRRRWSSPPDSPTAILAPLSPKRTLTPEVDDRRSGAAPKTSTTMTTTTTDEAGSVVSRDDAMPLVRRPNAKHVMIQVPDSATTSDATDDIPVLVSRTPEESRTLVILGMSFAACSGTLSGMSLLFAKCAVELLILTFTSGGRDNQFKNVQSWVLLIGLGATALLQLYYLNHSLRLASPALICPLAFCFYNVSSIFDGLVFYSQFSELAGYQIALVSVGIAILLVGVWSVSAIEPSTGQGGVEVGDWANESLAMGDNNEPVDDQVASPENMPFELPVDGGSDGDSPSVTSPRSPLSPTIDRFRPYHHRRRRSSTHQPRFGTLIPEFAPQGVPAGFSIGLNTSSPGFVLRGSHHHAHHQTTWDDGELCPGWNDRTRSRSEGGPPLRRDDQGGVGEGAFDESVIAGTSSEPPTSGRTESTPRSSGSSGGFSRFWPFSGRGRVKLKGDDDQDKDVVN